MRGINMDALRAQLRATIWRYLWNPGGHIWPQSCSSRQPHTRLRSWNEKAAAASASKIRKVQVTLPKRETVDSALSQVQRVKVYVPGHRN